MMAEDLFEDAEHRAEEYTSRHFDNTVEIWCPSIDETKVVLGHRYLRHCPMCGEEVEVDRSDAYQWSEPAANPENCECSWCAPPQEGLSGGSSE